MAESARRNIAVDGLPSDRQDIGDNEIGKCIWVKCEDSSELEIPMPKRDGAREAGCLGES